MREIIDKKAPIQGQLFCYRVMSNFMKHVKLSISTFNEHGGIDQLVMFHELRLTSTSRV